jgi:pyridoxal phosphate enzyme (YggS family)
MIDQSTRSRLESNWLSVKNEVYEAAERSGRSPESVKIVGVSKYVDAELTKALFDAGCVNLAESRPQNLWKKADAFATRETVAWHLIGHLQRNKVRRTLPIRPLIHSVDSQRLIDAIAQETQAQGIEATCLLEVNVSGDDAKTGMSKDVLDGVLSRLPISGLRVTGLMAMAGWGTDPDHARRQFDQLRTLRDDAEQQYKLQLPELSMGMSGDFPEAIAAGATMVRIGSRLFEGIIER